MRTLAQPRKQRLSPGQVGKKIQAKYLFADNGGDIDASGCQILTGLGFERIRHPAAEEGLGEAAARRQLVRVDPRPRSPLGLIELLAEAEHYGSDHHDGGDFHGFLLLPAPEWHRTACWSDAVARKKVAGLLISDERLRVSFGRRSRTVHHHQMVDAADWHPSFGFRNAQRNRRRRLGRRPLRGLD